MQNPFDLYDLDPRAGICAITARLRQLAEDAPTEADRDRIRAAWEELTLHPARRLRAALFARPETRAPLGSPPPLPRLRLATAPLGLRDLAARPSVAAALGVREERDAGAAVPPLESDPLL